MMPIFVMLLQGCKFYVKSQDSDIILETSLLRSLKNILMFID